MLAGLFSFGAPDLLLLLPIVLIWIWVRILSSWTRAVTRKSIRKGGEPGPWKIIWMMALRLFGLLVVGMALCAMAGTDPEKGGEIAGGFLVIFTILTAPVIFFMAAKIGRELGREKIPISN